METNAKPMTVGGFLIKLLQGVLIGLGAVLPGISGGVLCVVFGVYAPIMALLSNPFRAFKRYALTLLPVVSGAAVPGLAVGCLLGNLTSPYGLVDIVCGTCASLLAAVGARLFARVRLRGIPVVSLLMPIVCNAVVVGAEITFLAPEGFALPAFLSAAASVAAGEAAVVVLLGLPLLLLAEKAGLGLLSDAEK